MPFRKSPQIPVDPAAETPEKAQLLAALDAADPVNRQDAARRLVQFPDAIIALSNRLVGEGDPATRETLAVCIGRIGGENLVPCVRPLLRSGDPALRNIAVEILKDHPGDIATHIPAMLADPDPDFRIQTINILKSLQHGKVESWLLEFLVQEQNPVVISCALEVLGEVGTRASELPVREVKARFPEIAYVTFAADLVLSRIESARP